MDAVTYVAASQLKSAALVEAFNRGFTGYYLPLTQTMESLRVMTLANDIRLDHSLVALDAAGEPLGIALLGLRPPRGWVGGMGIAPEWRGQGYGAAVMHELIARCQAVGLSELQLEVLEQNAPARHLYTTLGFAETRPLRVFTGPLALFTASPPPPVSAAHTIAPLDAAGALAHFAPLHHVAPPWQRDHPSLAHAADRLSALGLWDGSALAAYLLYGSGGGGHSIQDAGSAAANPDERARQIETLIRALVSGDASATIRAVNVPPGDALGDALEALGCPIVLHQREMALALAAISLSPPAG